jgi:hypothetical protein
MNPTEMYKADRYRVAHSREEIEQLLKLGWVLDRPEGHPYIPHTAPETPAAPETPKRGPGRPPLSAAQE